METQTHTLRCRKCSTTVTRSLTLPAGSVLPDAPAYLCPECGANEPGCFPDQAAAERFLRRARRRRMWEAFRAGDVSEGDLA